MKRARSPSSSPLLKKSCSLPSLSNWQFLHNSVLALPPSTHPQWQSCVTDANGIRSLKIAAFDLDDTLIVPKSGLVFPRDDPTDWRWLTPAVPGHVRLLHDEGFMIVIFSNQASVGGKAWNEKKAVAVKEKILLLSKELRVPLAAFLATRDDVWRKPNIGMWSLLCDLLGNDGVSILSPASFYVGDAAGRKIATLAGRKKDFSCSDRKFAINIGLTFLTPEQFYSTPKEKVFETSCSGKVLARELVALAATPCDVDWDGLGPDVLNGLPNKYDGLLIQCIRPDGTSSDLRVPSPPVFHRASQEMVLFVGPPGCGKSTFFNRFFKPFGYIHVNRDTLKTKEKSLAVTKQAWEEGKSIVVDNTNPTHSDCQAYIQAARQSNSKSALISIRVFVFEASKELAMHMSNVRTRSGTAPKISRVVYNVFQSKYNPWTPDAAKAMGVEEILRIPPVAFFDGLPEATRREFFLLS